MKVPSPAPAAPQLAAAAVRSVACPLCSAPPSWSCGLTGCHLSRWLRAFALGLITRPQLTGAVRGLVVITAAQLVSEPLTRVLKGGE